jgi:hypothetical protein
MLGAVAVVLSGQATAVSPNVGPVKPPATDADKIRSAMSAAPAVIARDAAIMEMPSMKMRAYAGRQEDSHGCHS